MNGSAGDPSGSSEPKPWERSWSTDEMRQNAHAWNLAGDTGLLKYLQEFSQVTLENFSHIFLCILCTLFLYQFFFFSLCSECRLC